MAAIPPGHGRSGRLSQRAKGAGYETLARRYLERAGLAFTAANVAVRGG